MPVAMSVDLSLPSHTSQDPEADASGSSHDMRSQRANLQSSDQQRIMFWTPDFRM